MERIYVPPIKIQGIKTKLVPLIKKYVDLNKDTLWIEPFMGSGVVGFNVAPRNAIFSDTNPHIIEFYNQLKTGEINSKLVRTFLEAEGEKLEKFDDKYFYLVRERFNENHNPLDFLFLNRSCFNGMIRFNKKYEFNVPYNHKPQRFSKAYITKIVNQVKHLEDTFSLNEWTFKCQSFEVAISQVNDNCFVYCDPPYIGRHVDYYDSWDEKKEKLLRDKLIEADAKYMLSTWDKNKYRENEYIDKIWGDCNKFNQEHFYYVGAKEGNRNSMLEALLVNYEPTFLEKEVI